MPCWFANRRFPRTSDSALPLSHLLLSNCATQALEKRETVKITVKQNCRSLPNSALFKTKQTNKNTTTKQPKENPPKKCPYPPEGVSRAKLGPQRGSPASFGLCGRRTQPLSPNTVPRAPGTPGFSRCPGRAGTHRR